MVSKLTYFLSILVPLLLITCVPPEEIVLTEVSRDLRDSTLQKIIVFQDKQQTDSLLTFFRDKDPSYRYAAAMAFGSIKDKRFVDSLAILLDDRIPEVRVAAAYSIGQIGDTKGGALLTNAFEQTDTTGRFRQFNSAVLEAVGKCGSPEMLRLLSTISTYKATDTLLLEGQAWGIYRYALRQITSPEGTTRMLSFVNNGYYPVRVRRIAANYLARAKNIDISPNAKALQETVSTEKDLHVLLPLILALGKIDDASKSLLKILNKPSDYRVKVNAIRALNNANYDSVRTTIFSLLDDPDLSVAKTAANYLVQYGQPKDATFYWNKAKEDRPWQIQIALYDAANIHLPVFLAEFKGAINAELRKRFTNAQNPYERAAILRAIGGFGWNYQFMIQQAPTLQTAVEKTALVEGINRVVTNPNFNRTFGVSRNRVTRELANFLLRVFKSGDVGAMSQAVSILQGDVVDFKTILQDSLPIIETAQKNLPLPEATETFNDIQKAIDFFKETTTAPITPSYNHPIDMALLGKITTSASAVIQTDKGKIRLDLFPLLAPGTVVNFIALSESGYFKDKAFHRIVPNFVIQGGGPRGDGYGSLDYSIRSELPLTYFDDEGYIGMPSAGNHTEGVQFFITHSPTPHLDGNYTIFGKVTEGMDVVHQIEEGDMIQSVAIRY